MKIRVLSDDNIVLYGKVKDTFALTKYDIWGRDLSSVSLRDDQKASDLTEVTVVGKQCLAMSYRYVSCFSIAHKYLTAQNLSSHYQC